MRAYGHEIRNVLILACTEAEALWKRVLSANGAKGKKTRHYAVLSQALKLPAYSVNFPYYPWLQPVTPYERWGSTNSTTKDLPWYFAYNQVKHDRATNFSEATLERTFQALAGCFVMLCSEHGSDFALAGEAANRAFLRLIESPKWDPSEVYVPPYRTTLKSKNFLFRNSPVPQKTVLAVQN